MKTYILFAIFLTSFLLNAQIIKFSPLEKANYSEYIASAHILSKQTVEFKNRIYTVYQLQIIETLKGDLPEIIDVYQAGGILGDKALIVTPSNELETNIEGTFYLKQEEGTYFFALPAESFENIRNIRTEEEPQNSIFSNPVINNISPAAINAGIGDVLTITGSGFGTAGPNNSNYVALKYSNSLSNYVTMFNNYEYVSWSDTEIKIKFPSKGASGTVKVSVGGTTANSPSPVQVNFNVKDNVTATAGNIYPIYLPALSSNKIVFKPNTSFNNSDALNTIKVALDSWTCATDINWELDDTSFTTTGEDSNDGVNTIYYKSTGSALGVTYSTLQACSGSGRWVVTDIDIAINNSANFNYTMNPTTNSSYDFYHVILHELGHARDLGHTHSTTDIMYVSLGTGPATRDLSVNDIAGGNWVQNDGLTNVVCNKPQISNGTCQNLKTEDITSLEHTIKIWPNPCSNLLYISDAEKIKKLELYNTNGQLIKTGFSSPLNVESLAPGSYILQIRNEEGESFQEKIIKK